MLDKKISSVVLRSCYHSKSYLNFYLLFVIISANKFYSLLSMQNLRVRGTLYHRLAKLGFPQEKWMTGLHIQSSKENVKMNRREKAADPERRIYKAISKSEVDKSSISRPVFVWVRKS